MKKGWVVQTEEDNKVHARHVENGEVIDTPIIKVIKPENIDIISQDNQPINNAIKKDHITIHKDFLK